MTTVKAEHSSGHEQRHWTSLSLFLITVLSLVLCWLLIRPFISALVGAVTLAVVSQRPYRVLLRKLKNPTLTAAAAVFIIAVSLVTPVFFAVVAVVKQVLAGAALLQTGAPQQRLMEVLDRHPALARHLSNVSDTMDLRQIGQNVASYLVAHIAAFLGNSFGAFTQLFLMLFILFFLLRDKEIAQSFLRSLIPIRPQEKNGLISNAENTILATALGRVAVAGVQGILLGVAVWVLGIGHAVFWGLLTLLVSIVPAVGAFLVWIPLALYLAVTGHWIQTIILVAWGSLVVSTIDNFLYPILVGNRLRQHTVIVLMSVLGAISVFGVAGLILGPVLVTITKDLLGIWSARLGDTSELASTQS